MEPRINYATAAPGALNAMLALSKSIHGSGLDESLLNLVFLRAFRLMVVRTASTCTGKI